jgi:pSer/pThr/pTyr-binding forkhead associated (FHA) protein
MPIKNIYLTALIIHLDLFTAIKSIEAIKDRGKISTLFSAIRLATIFFHYGDNFTVGNTDYINQAKQHQKNSSQAVSFEAQTLTLDKPLEKTFGPRLVCTMPSGENNIYPLNQQKLIIGRSNEADINLLDPLVSRRHCVIEKKDNGFIARNVSTTNPLFVNDQAITEKRLYSGDQLKLGKISIAFISDKPEDVRPIEKKNVAQHKKPSLGLWTAGLLLFFFGGYLLYFHAYTPWKINRILYSVSKQIDIGVYQASQDTLKRLLKSDLSPEITHKAMELLAQTALAIAQQKSQNESLENAKAYLVAYLADYGAGSEAEFLWLIRTNATKSKH